MKKKVFYSFHYEKDHWRVNQVRNIGAIEGNTLLQSNEWEELKRTGKTGVEKWIQKQLKDRVCTVVLIGAETAKRPWVRHEIIESWNQGLGVFGIYIDRLKDQQGEYSDRGDNPFSGLVIAGVTFDEIVETKKNSWFYDGSKDVYSWIAENMDSWVEEAVEIRNRYFLK